MSTAPDEADGTISGTDGDVAVGGSTGGASTTGGGSSTGGVSTGGSSAGGVSTGGTSSGDPSAPVPAAGGRSAASDSRRVAPKWLGKKIGRFRLQALLGAGAVGRVFRAEDAILHRRVALKVIAVHGNDGQINRNADQFLTEARAAAALEHPHVVQIYEAGESGNLCYIAMELLDGGSLKELVDAGGPMDPARACLLAADAAEALAAGHQAGIIHRDIKPANLMISRQGRCKVTDFGLATFADAETVSRDKAAGTPLYAAPEVIRGTSADERSDIYSLGATLYFLLAGRPPYKAKTRAEVLRMHLDEPIPDLRRIRPGLPESLVAAVERSLDKDPGQRFTSATQFARVLRVQTVPVSAMAAAAGPLTAASLPPLDASPGASLMNLSGMTPVVGGSSGRLGVTGSVGPLSEADLPATVPPQPAASPVPPVVDYDSPAAPPVPWWRSPTWWRTRPGLLTIGGAGVGLLLLFVALLFNRVAPRPAPVVAATPLPLAVSPAPSVVPTPLPPPAPTASKPPAGTVAAGDLDQLKRIATGRDPARADHAAVVVGKVDSAQLGSSGKVVKIEFVDAPFVAVYFDDKGTLFQRMNDRYGENAANLAGKTVRVSGKLKMYNNAPEIVLTSPDQVTVEP